MIQFISYSKPDSSCEEKLGRNYIRAKISLLRQPASDNDKAWQLELFTQKQAFQQNLCLAEVMEFHNLHAGKTFGNAVMREVLENGEQQETTVLTNRKGQSKTLVRKIKASGQKPLVPPVQTKSLNRTKNYILKEGIPVPFLVKLGVMTEKGQVIASRYDKYRQINRFLEYIRDILPEVKKMHLEQTGSEFTQQRPLYIADFGCGKSYLTFAVYYYLTELCGIPTEITGLDLKQDVIQHCQNLADEFGYTKLTFKTGDVQTAEEQYSRAPDIMITLHACDTATDYALHYAITKGASAILSVPCCQHEINQQLQHQKFSADSPFASFANWGILQERMSALATDAIRAELLEQQGYSVQLLEFIDFEGTPKNLLIRAVKKSSCSPKSAEEAKKRQLALQSLLNVKQTLNQLLN